MPTRATYLRNGRLGPLFVRWAAGGAHGLGFDLGGPDLVQEARGKHGTETAGAGLVPGHSVRAVDAFLSFRGTFL